jgi:hypothetical protein
LISIRPTQIASPIKMKYTKYLLLSTLIGCGTASEKTESENTTTTGKVAESFLEKFREVSLDTLEVYSTDDLENTQFAFRGTELDSIEIAALPTKMKEVFGYDRDFYGCYQFRIDSIHVGLIIRTPSEYVPSSIKLFILDNSRKEILDTYVELAESTGDAGYAMTKTSLIFRDGLKVNYLVWQQDSEDMSVENENDTTIRTSDYLHLLAFDKSTFDTLSSNTDELLKMYNRLDKIKE